jgi:hypothetical protein
LLSSGDALKFEKPFFYERELKDVVFDSEGTDVPVLDGFSFRFVSALLVFDEG